MRTVVTLGTVSMAVPREGYIVMAVAARRASMPGMMRWGHVPHMVSQPSKGHHHEASRPECKAEHVRIHGMLPTKYSVTRCVQTPGKGSMSQALCKRLAASPLVVLILAYPAMLLPYQSDPCAWSGSTPTEWMMDIATLRSAYLRGQTSPTEQVERFLVQSEDPDWAVLWISRVSTDRLRQQARDLEERRRADAQIMDRLFLYGVLFAVKDNIDVAGMPTTAGCPAFAYTPACSAPVVTRLEAAGAILVGKTNLDQFATGLVGTRSPYGAVPNAFKPEYIAGGSS